jgi:solute carrier family 25 thiamine pyrophosphate transporter 19
MLSGALSRCVVAPLDVVKIKQQISTERHSPGTLQIAREVLATQGLPGFWRGNLPALMLWASFSAIQFPLYRSLSASCQGLGFQPSVGHAVAGACAGAVATTITYPLDLLRTRVIAASQSRGRPRALALVRQQLLQHSIRGLYHGLTPALLSVMPSSAILFLVYEPLRTAFAGHSGVMHHVGTALGVGSAAGAAAGMASKLATYPLDTARKRMQVRSMQGGSGTGNKYTLAECLRDTHAQGGVRALYRGLTPAMLKVGVSMGPALAVYEATRSLLLRGALS